MTWQDASEHVSHLTYIHVPWYHILSSEVHIHITINIFIYHTASACTASQVWISNDASFFCFGLHKENCLVSITLPIKRYWQASSNMKYQSLTESKRCEYRFLCSAQAHCVVCLEFYNAIPGFNSQCKSMGKAARGWATTATGRRRIQAAQIPAEIGNMAGCTRSMR